MNVSQILLLVIPSVIIVLYLLYLNTLYSRLISLIKTEASDLYETNGVRILAGVPYYRPQEVRDLLNKINEGNYAEELKEEAGRVYRLSYRFLSNSFTPYLIIIGYFVYATTILYMFR